MKKLSAILMAFIMAVGCINVGTLDALAAEATVPYTYSLQNWDFPQNVTPDNFGSGSNIWLGCVTSPFYVDIKTSKSNGNNEVLLFDLYDETTKHTVETFCIDVDTPVGDEDLFYKRINLEDSSYFADDSAQRIRAIVNHGVLVMSLADMENAANQWLDDQGGIKVKNLTGAEALSATQYAIWCTANADTITSSEAYGSHYVPSYRFVRASAGSYEYDNDDSTTSPIEVYTTQCGNPIRYNQEEQKETVAPAAVSEAAPAAVPTEVPKAAEPAAANPETPAEPTKDPADTTPETPAEPTEDPTEPEEPKPETPAEPTEEPVDPTAAPSVRRSVPQPQAAEEINISQQNIEGVAAWLLSLPGEEPTGVAVSDSTIQDASVVYLQQEDGSYTATIQFWVDEKLTLSNASLTLTVSGEERSVTQDLSLGRNVMVLEGLSKEAAVTVAIDGQQQVSDVFFFEAKGGREASQTLVGRDGCMIPVHFEATAEPGTNGDENGPEVKKNVEEIGQTLASAGAGKAHTWLIRGDIPADLADARIYRMTDTLDYRLNYAGDEKVTVKVASKEAHVGQENMTLFQDEDYTVVSKTSSQLVGKQEKPVTTVTVSLTATGMKKVAQAYGTQASAYEIRVGIQATVNQNAQIAEEIPNQSMLEYWNDANVYYKSDSNIAKVYPCGLQIYKHDAETKDTALLGARFRIARLASEAEIQAGKSHKLLTKNGEVRVVYESFYAAAEDTAELTDTVETGTDGKAYFYGLAEGSYYLVETKAPEGYQLLNYPLEVTVGKESHSQAVSIANSSSFIIPETGGMGTLIFTVGGAGLVAAAAILLVLKKRKEQKQEKGNL